MSNPYPLALRERAGRTDETTSASDALVAARFAISVNTLIAWVRRRLIRTLRPGDVPLLDNLAAHKAPAVAA